MTARSIICDCGPYSQELGFGPTLGESTSSGGGDVMAKTLSGKVALVTGGSRGIGAASARALAGGGS